MKKEVVKENRTATDIEVSQGGYIPITAYIEKYGEEISDEKLGTLVRKNYARYQNSIAENKEKWKEEGGRRKESNSRKRVKP